MVAEPPELNLKQVAAVLGVHYMTVYRYVRSQALPAHRIANNWMVTAEDVKAFQGRHLSLVHADVSVSDGWRIRVRRALEVGDETEGWRILDQALASGVTPIDCYVDILAGALSDISNEPRDAPLASEYLAVSTASRLVARLGARLRRPGRRRGTVIFGAPKGDYHSFPIAVVSDVVRLAGFDCLELGTNVPAQVFAAATIGVPRLVAVGIGVTIATQEETLSEAVRAIRAVDPDLPIVLGGQSSGTLNRSPLAPDFLWADTASDAVALFVRLAEERRPAWALNL